jgi:hypothetical protein
MRSALACAVFLLAACAAQQGTPSFEGRVASARTIEEEPVARAYLERHLFPAMRTGLPGARQQCFSAPAASTADFTIVADIVADGSLANVAVQPATNTARCFAASFAKLRLPPPPSPYSSRLPIFIEMELGGSNSVR